MSAGAFWAGVMSHDARWRAKMIAAATRLALRRLH